MGPHSIQTPDTSARAMAAGTFASKAAVAKATITNQTLKVPAEADALWNFDRRLGFALQVTDKKPRRREKRAPGLREVADYFGMPTNSAPVNLPSALTRG